MLEQKYIVIKDGANELMFTCPRVVQHRNFFESVQTMKEGGDNNWRRPYRNHVCVAAGFILDGQCYGRSESLGVDSRPAHDTLLLAMGGAS